MGAVVLLFATHVGIAKADGTFIPAANRTDMVYDASRDLIYIADGSSVLRYDIIQGGFLAPVNLGGQLVGMDLSPDSNTLAVADSTDDGVHEWVHLVNLNTLVDAKALLPFPAAGGTRTVAFVADGSLMVTSAWQVLRLNISTGQWSYPAEATGGIDASAISASGDGETIATATAGGIPGAWGIYYALTDQYEQNPYIDWFTFEIAANSNGTQFAVPTYDGTFIYDSAHNLLATLGTYAGQEPIGVAYHPVENQIFLPWEGTSEVRVYDTTTFQELGSFDFQDTFEWNGNSDFAQGHTRISLDGSLLMVSVTGGVRFLRMYSPLAAQAITVNASGMRGAGTVIPLKGPIGNGAALSYNVVSKPAHGLLSIVQNRATYIAFGNFTGMDSFTYSVGYGRATAMATVSINVGPPGKGKPTPLSGTP